ncbi:MAG TPA: hypothetical protein VF624_01050, partial [Tepidisphaeraceae bacterium]
MSTTSYTVNLGTSGYAYFDYNATENRYVERYGGTASLRQSGGQFVYTDASGESIIFDASFDDTDAGLIAKAEAYVTASGESKRTVVSTDSNGRTTEIVSATDGESWLYSYFGSGVNAGMLNTVTRRKDVGGTYQTVETLSYTYHDGTTANGTARQIRTAVIADASGNAKETAYYRYYADDLDEEGYAGALKYSLSDKSYRQLLAAHPSSTIDQLTDTQVAAYADMYFEYDDSKRVALRTVQGDGCSACTGGQGSYTYVYESSAHAAGVNSWTDKVIETLPDGNQNVSYYNADGQVMLSVFVNTATNAKWGTFHVFDADGREVMTASPSAVALPSSFTTIEAYADLLHSVSGNYQYLHDAAGQINVTDYYGSTSATETAAGGVAGYEQYRKVKQGETGTAVLLGSTTYIGHDDDTDDADDTLTGGAADQFVYPVASETQYRNADGTGAQTTTYAYTWYTDSLQAATKTTTDPVVTTAQNGSNSATSSVHFYDTHGRVVWSKDEAGFLIYNAYDLTTGGLLKQIVDVKTTQTSDFANLPSGWTTPTGGGLHLITTMLVDDKGRTTKLVDPNGNVNYTVYNDVSHEVRTYRGWNATTGTTTGPIEVRREDRSRGYGERFTMSATPAVSGSSGSYVPTGGESIGNLQSLTRDVLNASGQVVYRDVYTSGGLSYSTNVTIGTAGTDYLRTELGYDWRGRQARVKAPDGTWTHTVYDGLGRAASVWKGTNNAGWTQTDPSNGGSGGNNMVKVSESTYDNGSVGDGNLTESKQWADGSTSYVTQYQYDFRDRMIGMRGADNVAGKYTLDNLGRQTVAETYADADSDFVIDTGELRGKSESAYDERGQLYQSTVHEVDPATAALPGTISDSLSTKFWYDARGNQIKSQNASGLINKTFYDGAGRVFRDAVSADPTEVA